MSNVMGDSWKEEVVRKLVLALEDNVESWTRVVFYLTEEDRVYSESQNTNIPPAWRILKAAMDSPAPFKSYALRLAEDTKRDEIDEGFRKTMNAIYEEMIKPSELPTPEEDAQGFNFNRFTRVGPVKASTLPTIGLTGAWNMIPAPYQAELLEYIRKHISNRTLLSSVDECVSLASKRGGKIVMEGLAVIYLGIVAIQNIRRWWKGEISGKRCAKNVVDASVSIGAGLAGGLGGAAIGALAGPIGAFAGGIIGGIISAQAAEFLCDRLTQYLFGIPKEEALENAYNFLGVKMTASNNEINTAFRQLCLKHHPDKGGETDDFITVQVNMAVVKVARGQL